MKTLILTLVMIAGQAQAHMITGQRVLKGTARTKVPLQGQELNCHVKVDEVKNNLVEDDFGNPAYYVWTKIDLRSGLSSAEPVNHSLNVRFTNIARVGSGTMVSDEDYRGEDVTAARMRVDERGRIRSVTFPVGARSVTCNF